MKKGLPILIAFLAITTLTACGDKGGTSTTSSSSTSSTSSSASSTSSTSSSSGTSESTSQSSSSSSSESSESTTSSSTSSSYEPTPAVWPSEIIAEYIGDHTDETLPAAQGTEFSTYEIVAPYNALIIDVFGGVDSVYISTLESAGWRIFDLMSSEGYYDCHSPKRYLEVIVTPYVDKFEIQLILAEPPSTSWPTDEINNYFADDTKDTVPPADGLEFYYEIPDFPHSSIEIDVIGGNLPQYFDTLRSEGWKVYDSSFEDDNFYYCASPSRELNLAIKPNNYDFYINISLLGWAAVWPTDKLATAVQKLVPGSTTVIPEYDALNYVVNDYFDIEACFIMGSSVTYATIIQDYSETLENEGWAVSLDPSHSNPYIIAISPSEDIRLEYELKNYGFQMKIAAN